MKIRTLLLLSFGTFLLQSTVFQNLRLDGVLFNFNILILVMFIIHSKDLRSILYYALISGILQDVFSSPLLGINTFIYIFIIGIAINMESIFSKVSMISPLVLISVATVTYHSIYYLTFTLLNWSLDSFLFFKIILVELFLNLIIGVILHKVLVKFQLGEKHVREI